VDSQAKGVEPGDLGVTSRKVADDTLDWCEYLLSNGLFSLSKGARKLSFRIYSNHFPIVM
jgi:hypothetical protein